MTVYFIVANKWEIPAETIRISSKLGRGEFGSLYDAEMKLSNGQLVRALIKASSNTHQTTNQYM